MVMQVSDGPGPDGAGFLDVRLSGLTPRQSRRVRELARAALAERGIETTVFPDHLATADGRVFGLENLASKCHNHPQGQRAWAGLVRDHLGALLAEFPGPPPELTVDQIRAGVHVRLVRLSTDQQQAYRYARTLGGGLVQILVHVNGGYVRWLTDDEVARVGVETLTGIGLQNLATIRPDGCEIWRGDDTKLCVLRGGSGFIASKLLVLPEVIRIVMGRQARYPDGVLVAVPTRHDLAFAPVSRDLVANLAALMSYAAHEHNHGVAPLSPHVYWWRWGEVTSLTEIDRTGRVEANLTSEFIDVATRLSAGAGGLEFHREDLR